jgi:Glycosyl hydrolase family 71
VPSYSVTDWENDIGLAQTAHIDAFALNIAYRDSSVNTSLHHAFDAATAKGFQLFLSFDYAGGGPWPAGSVYDLARQFTGLPSYFHYKGQPLISTFEGPGNAGDWKTLKQQLNCFFIPDWSSLGADAAMKLGVADGLFSWNAWAWGNHPIDTYSDASYINSLNGKPYMMPASPWFFTNLPGYNKNWIWRGDDAWYDRWVQILWLQPEFVEIISWNDYGESHYIGPLYDQGMGAFTVGKAPYNYASGMPHDGWRLFLPYLIDTYKKGIATITQEGLVGWYRLSPAAACSTGGTSGNTASQLQLEFPPATIVEDSIFYSALLGSSATVTVSIGGTTLPGSWVRTPESGIGIYHGSVSFAGHTGTVVITLSRGGTSIAQITGPAITTSCPSGITNWNAWVGSAPGGSVSATPTLSLSQQGCVNATGANNFAGLCSYACQFGTFCPKTACVCLALGAPKTEPKATHAVGYPLAGEDASYLGLCAYDCERGYCPGTACGTV